MHYVEILRGRNILKWYTIALLALLGLIAITFLSAHEPITDAGPIPLGEVLLGCTLGAYIFATIVGAVLANESQTLPITWTRPVSRAHIAWRFVAVDLAAIFCGYLVTIGIVLACIALFGLLKYVQATPAVLVSFGLGLGSAMMWYGLVQLASARLAGHGARVAGLSWLAFIVISLLWALPLPAPIHALATALNYLNPLAYISGVTVGHGHQTTHPILLPDNARLVLVWAIAAISTAIAVRLWSTKEA